jgi:hypothetical protein
MTQCHQQQTSELMDHVYVVCENCQEHARGCFLSPKKKRKNSDGSLYWCRSELTPVKFHPWMSCVPNRVSSINRCMLLGSLCWTTLQKAQSICQPKNFCYTQVLQPKLVELLLATWNWAKKRFHSLSPKHQSRSAKQFHKVMHDFLLGERLEKVQAVQQLSTRTQLGYFTAQLLLESN